MSRSRVKRGLAWTTTATPPITTKSISPCTSAPIRAAGWKSGQFATVRLARAGQPSSLLVHHFQALQSLCRLEFELLADQAFIDRRPARACGKNQLDSRCAQSPIQRGQAWVRVGSLELSDGRLADRQALPKLGLRQSCASSGVRNQLAGERCRA